MPTKILLTDIMHHTRAYRPSKSFGKVSRKGRMYLSPPKFWFDGESGRIKFSLDLPDDLATAIKQGKVELVLPEGGLYAVLGPDVLEKIEQLEQKHRKLMIHQGRTWHKE